MMVRADKRIFSDKLLISLEEVFFDFPAGLELCFPGQHLYYKSD